MRQRPAAVLAAAAIAVYAGLQVAGRFSGSSRAERARPLPGDDLIPHPGLVTNHAVTLGGPPEEVWPWLAGLGWYRGGWHSPRWMDRLLYPRNWASRGPLPAELARGLRSGDRVAEGLPGAAPLVIEVADEPRTLVVHSVAHTPPGWSRRLAGPLEWVWIFQLEPASRGRTRLLLRNRAKLPAGWATVAGQAVIAPADHVVATGMLHGLRRRVARDRRLGSYLRRRRPRTQGPAQTLHL